MTPVTITPEEQAAQRREFINKHWVNVSMELPAPWTWEMEPDGTGDPMSAQPVIRDAQGTIALALDDVPCGPLGRIVLADLIIEAVNQQSKPEGVEATS